MSNIDIIMNEEKPKKPVVVLKKNIANINDIFFPKQRDPLFWCFYIILNDTYAYEMVPNFLLLKKRQNINGLKSFVEEKNYLNQSRLVEILWKMN